MDACLRWFGEVFNDGFTFSSLRDQSEPKPVIVQPSLFSPLEYQLRLNGGRCRPQYDYEAYNHGLSNGSAISTHSPKFFSMAHVISNGSNGFKNAAKLLTSRRLPLVHAFNKPSNESIEKTEGITSGDTSTPQGPPFLTILAGIIVFALVLWVMGSIVSWLIGLLGLIFSK